MTARAVRTATVVALCLVVSACAQPPSTRPTMVTVGAAAGADARWYQTCFRLAFDDLGEPVWASDLVIADRVVGPVLEEFGARIRLWRIHRRATAIMPGHQFSLMVYTAPPVYAEIGARIDQSAVIAELAAGGYLDRVIHDCHRSDDVDRPELIEAYSDGHWAPELQRAWPYFIMGVSASWLALVQETAAALGPLETPLPPAYEAVDQRVTEIWRSHAQHGFIHHLSAVFGYQPMLLQKLIRF